MVTSGVDAVGNGLTAGRLDRRQPVGQHCGKNVDHLPIAVVGSGEFAPHALDRGRQHPIFEGRPVAQGAGLAGEHRDIMPGVVDRLAAAKRARMLGNNPAVLAATEYLLLSKRTRQVLETEAGTAWKPANRPAWGSSFGRSASNTSQMVCSLSSGWRCALA